MPYVNGHAEAIGNLSVRRDILIHMQPFLEMAESSADKLEYETKIAQRFGFEQQLGLPIPIPAAATETKEAAN